jgi:hypothetical protein
MVRVIDCYKSGPRTVCIVSRHGNFKSGREDVLYEVLGHVETSSITPMSNKELRENFNGRFAMLEPEELS